MNRLPRRCSPPAWPGSLLLILLLLSVSPVTAQTNDQVKAIRDTFLAAEKQHNLPLRQWDVRYLQELTKLENKAQASGDLETLLSTRREMETPGQAEISDSATELHRLRGIYLTQKAKLETTKAAAMVGAIKLYRTQLTALQRGLTRAGRIDEAVAIKALLDEQPETAAPFIPDGRSIDVIAMLDLQRDRVHGQWEKRNRELHALTGGLVPRLHIPYLPPAEFDIDMAWTQPDVRNEIWVSITIDEQNISFNVGKGYAGFEEIDNERFTDSDNQSRFELGKLEPNKKYSLKLQVRKQGLRGFVNGKPVATIKIEPERWSRSIWKRMRYPQVPAFGCDDPTVFHYVRLTPISGAGKKVEDYRVLQRSEGASRPEFTRPDSRSSVRSSDPRKDPRKEPSDGTQRPTPPPHRTIRNSRNKSNFKRPNN